MRFSSNQVNAPFDLCPFACLANEIDHFFLFPPPSAAVPLPVLSKKIDEAPGAPELGRNNVASIQLHHLLLQACVVVVPRGCAAVTIINDQGSTIPAREAIASVSPLGGSPNLGMSLPLVMV